MLAHRFASQLLAGRPARDPVAVAERVLAIQGQDPRGFRLAVRARSRGLSVADVDRALTEERSLVVTWLNRGTLHLVRSEDYPWLHALTAPRQVKGIVRRLAQEGVDEAAAGRAVGAIEAALADEGPLTREQLRDRVTAAGTRTEGQALIQLLALAAARGLIVRGPMSGRQHLNVLTRDWLGEPAPVDREAALAELARRYLAGHGPATDRDLAYWSGLPLRDARAGLAAIAGELREREDGLVELAGRGGRVPKLPPPRLLGSFDPVLHGWATREPVVGEHEPKLVSGGIFRPFALAGGRAVATWRLTGGEVELTPFGKLDPDVKKALDEDAADVLRFIGT